jgi:CheY-like chemotaxis protein
MASAEILFVDDDRAYLGLVKSLFEGTGIKVSCAENGEDAIKDVRERRFPLVFTDCKMPGMDGLELARRCKEICPETHIVMITGGNTQQKLFEEARKAGVSGVYAKPFNLKGFLHILDEEMVSAVASFKGITDTYARSILSVNEQKEKVEHPLSTDREHGMTSWICPKCGTHFIGWSTLNVCSRCGYRE